MEVMNPARQYRRAAAHSATPVGLVVLLYEAALDSLYRAVRAQEAGNIEERTTHLNRVLAVLGELQAALDFERGGEVARSLRDFYHFAHARLLEGSVRSSKEILVQVTEQFRLLRDAWQQVEPALAGGSEKSATKYPAPPGETPTATYPGTAPKEPAASTPGTMHWSA